MRFLIKFICSPVLTMALVVLITALWTGILKADEIPVPLEGAGCKDNTKMNCGE